MLERRPPVDIATLGNPIAEQAFTFFCRHLVSLVCRCDPAGSSGGPPECFAFSGQILSIRGAWCLLTAGHILKGIEQRENSGRWHLQFFLADHFGPDVVDRHLIPFLYESASKAYFDQDGLDFGLVSISPYYRRLLEKNGVVA